MDNTNNKAYWDEYVTYWENKVNEANCDENAKDKTTDDTLLERYFNKLNVSPEEKLLDYGCGSCRLFPIYNRNTLSAKLGGLFGYSGIDVSGVPLEHARKKYKELGMQKESLKEFDGITIPFADGYFDKIICYSVFDACNQENTLRELLRVLKIGGTLLLTGKNNKYFEDDEEAAIAEVNARKKGHPNYFTDVYNMIKQLENNDVEIIDSYYFLRRCDFPIDNFVKDIPETFYQFGLLMTKGENTKNIEYQQFSNKYSLHK
jgi:ubiquinone/menaquinone biosynthesis C-methylase UbiE